MKSALPSVAVEGVAFWAPQLPGWDVTREAIRGALAPAAAVASRPTPNLLAPTERRRAPDTVAVALEVAARACESAGRSPTELPAVFASTYGDLGISDYMCATLAQTPALISPIKFHNSVHNAAAGYWSIGTRSYAAYTAISAFQYTFAAGLLETATQVACDGKPVLYVAFDVEARGPLRTVAASRGVMGAALVLGPCAGARSNRQLALRLQTVERPELSPARSPATALVHENALAPCLPLFEALASDSPSSVALALSARTVLHVEVS